MSQLSSPAWQAHSVSDYDSRMQQRCDALLAEIVIDQARRKSILADPRDLHRELFADLTPQGCGEYAGNYRGTPGTALEARVSVAASTLNPGNSFAFMQPQFVPAAMEKLVEQITASMSTGGTDYEKLTKSAMAFGYFGMIHPFLDGNGHVQRAIFAAMITEFGYPLNGRFALHPRPFDAILAIALELFTTTGHPEVEGPLLAEYLGYYVDGPFLAVRGTLQPGKLY